MRWSLINASQFVRKAFSCLCMGLIMIRINITNEIKNEYFFKGCYYFRLPHLPLILIANWDRVVNYARRCTIFRSPQYKAVLSFNLTDQFLFNTHTHTPPIHSTNDTNNPYQRSSLSSKFPLSLRWIFSNLLSGLARPCSVEHGLLRHWHKKHTFSDTVLRHT